MQTNQLQRNHPNRKRMTVARGGKRGKTSGRGGKGQTARAGNKRRPEWRDIIKKLPKLRGRGKNSNKTVVTNLQKPAIIHLSDIQDVFKAGETVTPTTLAEKGLIPTWSGRILRTKILGGGELKVAVKVSGCAVSESAEAAIKKAGGSVVPFVRTTLTQKVVVRDPVRAKEEAAKAATKAPAVAAKPAKAKEAKPKVPKAPNVSRAVKSEVK